MMTGEVYFASGCKIFWCIRRSSKTRNVWSRYSNSNKPVSARKTRSKRTVAPEKKLKVRKMLIKWKEKLKRLFGMTKQSKKNNKCLVATPCVRVRYKNIKVNLEDKIEKVRR